MTMISKATYKLLVLRAIKGIGNAKLTKIASALDFDACDVETLYQAYTKKRLEQQELKSAIEHAEQQIELAVANNTKIISFLDQDYPPLMLDAYDRPVIIYVKGKLDLDKKCYAVIGSRNNTKVGEEIAKRIVSYCVKKEVGIVSGLALGIDSIAHRAALDNNGYTIAILGHGLDSIYPSDNSALAQEILDKGGALISEYDFKVNVSRFTLVARDRIQAAMSEKVIMIESSVIGGSLHASRAILKYKRKLVVPYPIKSQIEHFKDKVEANIILSSDNYNDKKDLLFADDKKLPLDFADNIEILKSKADYDTYL